MASETESPDESQPAGRRSARHAAPRRTVRGRMQVPVGRALALTAVPTALLMGSIAPKLAFAADTSKAAPISTGTTAAAPTGSNCGKPTAASSGVSGTAQQAPQQGTPKTTPTSGTTQQKQGSSAASHSAVAPSPSATQRSAPVQQPAPTGGGSPTSAPTSAPAAPAPSPTPPGLIGGLLGGIGSVLGLDAGSGASGSATPSPTASTSATAAPRAAQAQAQGQAPAPAAAAVAATHVPSTPPAVSPSLVRATPSATASATPPAATPSGGPSKTPAPTASGTPSATAHQMCDASHLAAPLDTTVTPGEFPSDPWTLKSTDLKLINTVFHGVVTVQTTAGPVRVLKFTAEEVNIGDLDMSTKQHGQRLHVQGGPGTTSTMRGGTVTMYVTSLSGTLKAAEGIPLGWLNVSLTLTPDTLPDWLYNLIGSVPIPLTLEFSDATAIQTGQVGGDLTIPGMHLYYTPLN